MVERIKFVHSFAWGLTVVCAFGYVQALTETRSAANALRAEAADAARQRETAVAEAQAAAETQAKLRADSSKFAGRLSDLEVCSHCAMHVSLPRRFINNPGACHFLLP